MEFFREEKHPFGIWGGIDIVGYIGRLVVWIGCGGMWVCGMCEGVRGSAGGVDGWWVGVRGSIKWSFSVRKNILLGYGEELILVGVGRLVAGSGARSVGEAGKIRQRVWGV